MNHQAHKGSVESGVKTIWGESSPSLFTTELGKLRGSLYIAILIFLFSLQSPGKVQAQTNFWEPLNLTGYIQSLSGYPSANIFAGIYGGPLYKSTDSGFSWKIQGGSILRTLYSYQIAVARNGLIVTSNVDTVYLSTDGGHTWSSYNTGMRAPSVSVTVSPNQSIFVGFGDYRGIARSTNLGLTWDSLKTNFTNTFAVLGLATDKNGTIFAATEQGDPMKLGGGIFRSTDNGQTWQAVVLGANFMSIAVDDSGYVFAGSYPYWGGVFRSKNSGTSFTPVGPLGEDILSLAVARSGVVMAGTLDGAFLSTDHGDTWIQQLSGLADSYIRSAAFDLNGYAYAGTAIGLYKSVMPTTDVPKGNEFTSRVFSLFQNYPNPFNPSTTIRYGLPARSHASLSVYNTLGQEVAVLQNGEQEAGYHEVKFDGTNLASGVYFYRLKVGEYMATRRLLLVR